METIIIIALASAAISFTVTTTSIFLSFREAVSGWHNKIEELVHCPYCLGHYISAVMLLIYGDITNFKAFVLYWFAIIAVMAVIHFVLLRAYEPVARAAMYRQQEKRSRKAEQIYE